MFTSVGMPLATVALYTLAFGAACLGMCLGVLLPMLLPGVCFGTWAAIMLGIFMPNYTMLYMNIALPLAALVGGILSVR